MRNETLKSELLRLREEQSKTRQDEVFGGLSAAERSAYDIKADRIHKLERGAAERYGSLQKAS